MLTIKLDNLPMEYTPREAAEGSDEAEIAEFCRLVEQMQLHASDTNGVNWGWCTARVTAEYRHGDRVFTGIGFLPECSCLSDMAFLATHDFVSIALQALRNLQVEIWNKLPEGILRTLGVKDATTIDPRKHLKQGE